MLCLADMHGPSGYRYKYEPYLHQDIRPPLFYRPILDLNSYIRPNKVYHFRRLSFRRHLLDRIPPKLL